MCVKKTLHDYCGVSVYPFLYDYRSKKMLQDVDIPNKPEELEESLDGVFDEMSVKVKKAIIDEVKKTFGLTQDYLSLKDVFQSARDRS